MIDAYKVTSFVDQIPKSANCRCIHIHMEKHFLCDPLFVFNKIQL